MADLEFDPDLDLNLYRTACWQIKTKSHTILFRRVSFVSGLRQSLLPFEQTNDKRALLAGITVISFFQHYGETDWKRECGASSAPRPARLEGHCLPPCALVVAAACPQSKYYVIM